MAANRDLESFAGHVRKAVSKLPQELGSILRLRYELGSDGSGAVRRAAKGPHVPDELESEAIRKLRHPKLCRPIAQAFSTVENDIWTAVSDDMGAGNRVVRKNDHHVAVDGKLPGEILLAIHLLYGDTGQWLSFYARETDLAWFRAARGDDFILNTLSEIQRTDPLSFYPLPVDSLLDRLGLDGETLDLLTLLDGNRLHRYRGYIAPAPISSMDLRAIRTHLLLVYRYPEDTVAVDTLVDRYNRLYADDELNGDILLSVVRRKENLFRIDRGAVGAVGSVAAAGGRGAPGKETQDGDETAPHVFDRPWSETNVRVLVKEILDLKGFCRRTDIGRYVRERAGDRYYGAEFELPGVQFVLTSDPDIVEAAPSVYSLRAKLDHGVPETGDLLLSYADCKKYVVNRHAGEPMEKFPLWSFTMESRWCSWIDERLHALRNDGSTQYYHAYGRYRKLFESLLFVSDPDRWPLDEENRNLWRFRKQCWGTYHYQVGIREEIWQTLPTLQDVFIVSKVAIRSGQINYLRVNEALSKNRRSAAKSVPTLALLVLLGILEPAAQWQEEHGIGARAEARMDSMVQEIKKKGFLHWDDEAGRSLQREIAAIELEENAGWVDRDILRRITGTFVGKPHPSRTRDVRGRGKKLVRQPSGNVPVQRGFSF